MAFCVARGTARARTGMSSLLGWGIGFGCDPEYVSPPPFGLSPLARNGGTNSIHPFSITAEFGFFVIAPLCAPRQRQMPGSSEIQARNVEEVVLHLSQLRNVEENVPHLSQLRNAGTLTSYSCLLKLENRPPNPKYDFG